jgi:hypothetical protein
MLKPGDVVSLNDMQDLIVKSALPNDESFMLYSDVKKLLFLVLSCTHVKWEIKTITSYDAYTTVLLTSVGDIVYLTLSGKGATHHACA